MIGNYSALYFMFATYSSSYTNLHTVESLLRGRPQERPPPLERPLDNVNLNINVLISTPERSPLFKGHISAAKWVASQEEFHCTSTYQYFLSKPYVNWYFFTR